MDAIILDKKSFKVVLLTTGIRKTSLQRYVKKRKEKQTSQILGYVITI